MAKYELTWEHSFVDIMRLLYNLKALSKQDIELAAGTMVEHGVYLSTSSYWSCSYEGPQYLTNLYIGAMDTDEI